MTFGSFSSVPKVEIGGTLPRLLKASLDSCWVESTLNVPSTFHIAFKDKTRLLMSTNAQLKIGAPVTIFAVAGLIGEDQPLITGQVTGIEADYSGGDFYTVIRGMDHAFKLLRKRRVALYKNMSASDIVRQVAGQHGVAIGKIESTPPPPPDSQTSQPNVDDWTFLQSLAERAGKVVYFDNKGLLHFRAPVKAVPLTGLSADKSPYVLEFGANTLRCRSGFTAADQVSMVSSRGWNMVTKQTLIGRAQAAANPDVLAGLSPAQVSRPFGTGTLVETGTPYVSQSETDSAAKSLATDVTSSFAELEVAVRGTPQLLPDKSVTLTKAGTPFDGAYTVTGVRHLFEHGTYETWVSMTGRQFRSLYGLASGGAHGPGGTGQRMSGVVSGIVTDIHDPLRMGRVKLRFPWLDDDYVSDWARTVQHGGVSVHGGLEPAHGADHIPAGSPGSGGFIGYAVNDEVLVTFDRGDFDQPYVIGGLYNGVNKPTRFTEDNLVSKDGIPNVLAVSSRRGNRLELLDDELGMKAGVKVLTSDEKQSIELDKMTKTSTVKNSVGPIMVESNAPDGRVTIRSGAASITLTAEGTVNIEGATEVSVSAGAMLSLKAAELNLAAPVTTVESAEINFAGASFSVEAAEITLTGNVAIVGEGTIDAQQIVVI
ncbi:Rhs element Vgr protein [Catenulispora acidiphila DSM 44928]|uniref:Rhs element Vgr protein n=1 Tax=Catenulispora acidiphila (strain DSM 44928 / JCM 14897 / NBRC 102108 / NRRL B-24433 / ID139908) TaxID=479433 RepID=C7QK16_CATAD|nr:VgrG-related protein [Catenulispora acidiphila]ACU73254.1 Rhs element Vgr protein [Catenulispora acidiphila DSM 44928]